MEDTPSSMDPAAAFSNIEDDEMQTHEAAAWAEAELISGRTPEDLVSELVDQGWKPEIAERVVETARKETRAQRGVLTREDVKRDLDIAYRRGTGGVSVASRSVFLGVVGFTRGLLQAIATAIRLKRIQEQNRVDSRSDKSKE